MTPIIVGRIGSAYGVQGWTKVTSYTASKENILNYQPWQLLINGSWRVIKLLDGKQHGNGLVVYIEGYDSPEAVRQIVNVEIGIERAQLPELSQGEYYWADLVGIKVVNANDQALGTIASLFETGANDVIVVKGEKEVLIPYIPQVILSIDLKQKLMRVDWEA